jgi:DNA repair protein RecO (recombination protein O)
MAKTIKTEALVIHGMRWSDTSKIIHLFTSEKGYIKLIARGAMNPKSPFRGILENLNHIEAIISIKESRGLQILTQADLLHPFHNIREDINSTASSYAMLELIKVLVHYDEASHSFFKFTISLLKTMNEKEIPYPLLFLYRFILHLSAYLGFGWNLSECMVCNKHPQRFPLKIDVLNGAVICSGCEMKIAPKIQCLSEEQWQLLLRIQQIPIEQLASLSPQVENYQSLLDLLIEHINYHTEQTLQLKSLKMMLP